MQKTAAKSASSNDTSQTILTEARHLFAKRGFEGVSINDVAQAAGVSKANIFHHFGSKDALYLEVLKLSINEFGALTDHLEPSQAPIEKRLPHFLLAHAGHFQQHPESARVVLRELLENRTHVSQQLAEQAAGAQFARLFGLLRDAQQAGEIRTDMDAAALALMMIGVDVFMFQARDMLRHLPEIDFADNPGHYSHLLANILLHGITPGEKEQ
jgi:TetR/AcrR family transcriptional regulator